LMAFSVNLSNIVQADSCSTQPIRAEPVAVDQ